MAEFIEVIKNKKRMCDSVMKCEDCMLYHNNNNTGDTCNYFVIFYPEEAEEIIMNWAKEHPVKTNADKFKEVFGIDTYKETSLTFCPFINYECYSDDFCDKCERNKWWQQEYKEPNKAI